MVFFIPSWITVSVIVFRVLRRILGVAVECVLILLWVTGAVALGLYRLIVGLAGRDPEWARDALRSIRRLPETER